MKMRSKIARRIKRTRGEAIVFGIMFAFLVIYTATFIYDRVLRNGVEQNVSQFTVKKHEIWISGNL